MHKLFLLPALFLLLSTSLPAQKEIEIIYMLFQKGKMKEAMTRAHAYRKANPDEPAPYLVLGRMLVKQDPKKAIEHLERCLSLEPRPAWMTAWSHVALGEAYMQCKDVKQAEEHLKKAIVLGATRNATRTARNLLNRLHGKEPVRRKSVLVGRAVPDFAFPGLHGETHRREDFKGTPMFIKYGSSW